MSRNSSSSSTGSVPGADPSTDILSSSSNTNNNKSDILTSNDVSLARNCSFYYPHRLRVQYSCGSELITKQEFKDECDINNILTQYKRTGIITHIMAQEPVYGDLPELSDYQQSLELFRQSQEAFDVLPAAVRRYFQNDPAQLLGALGDPSMRTTLEELGVLQGPATPQPPGNPVNNNPSLAPTLRSEPVLPPSATPPPAPPSAPPSTAPSVSK